MKQIVLVLSCLTMSMVVSAQSLDDLEKQLKQQKEALEKVQKKNDKELKKSGLKDASSSASKSPKLTEHEQLLAEISAIQAVGLPLGFDNAHDFSEGLAAVSYRGKWGFVDTTGKFVIPPIYLSNSDKQGKHFRFSEGLVRIGSSYIGFMDKEGKEVVAQKFNNASGWDDGVGFSEGLAMITDGWKSDGNKGYIDKTGKKIIPGRYDIAKDFSEGMAAVGKRGLSENAYGYIDKSGKMVIAQQFAKANSFSEGLAAVHNGKGWGFIDKTGKELIPCIYESCTSNSEADELKFSEGMAAVCRNKKIGYINATGDEVVPFIYDAAQHFSEGLAAVKTGKKWGFIDKTGKEIIAPQYDFVRSFSEGLAVVGVRVGSEWKYGYINKNGAFAIDLFPCKLAYSFYNGRALIKGVSRSVPKGDEGIKAFAVAKMSGTEYKGEYEDVLLKAIFIDKKGIEIIR